MMVRLADGSYVLDGDVVTLRDMVTLMDTYGLYIDAAQAGRVLLRPQWRLEVDEI